MSARPSVVAAIPLRGEPIGPTSFSHTMREAGVGVETPGLKPAPVTQGL